MLAGCAIKPVPLSVEKLTNNAEINFDLVSSDQEPLTKPVNLYKAMARAMKYNLEYRLAASETQLGNAKLNLSHYSMLPDIAAKAGYAARDNENASSSLNVLSNNQNFGASTSQDKDFSNNDLTFSWNILDFGLSYVRSQQAGDKYLISQEMKRKVLHKLMDDVRATYWRAASHKRLIRHLRRINSRMEIAYKNTQTLSESGETPRVTALISQRELLDIKRAIGYLLKDLATAKGELAALMGLKPGMPFTLAFTERRVLPAKPPLLPQSMMITALRDRAELRENLYEQRINMREARAMLLQMLPGLNLYGGPNWNSNSFLLNNNWVSWGATASFNLLRVFQYPAKQRVVEAQKDVLMKRSLAISMAVMTQVHLSSIRFHQCHKERVIADEYRSVQNQLVRQFRVEAKASRVSEQDLLREEMNTLVAEAKYDIAYSNLQSAYASLFASIGWDPYVEADPSQGVNDIAVQLRDSWFETGKSNPII